MASTPDAFGTDDQPVFRALTEIADLSAHAPELERKRNMVKRRCVMARGVILRTQKERSKMHDDEEKCSFCNGVGWRVDGIGQAVACVCEGDAEEDSGDEGDF